MEAWVLSGKFFLDMWENVRVITNVSFPSLRICSTTISDEGRDFNGKESVVRPIGVFFIDIKTSVLPEKNELRIIVILSVWKRILNVLYSHAYSLIPFINLCPWNSPSQSKMIYFYLAFTPIVWKFCVLKNLYCFHESHVFWLLLRFFFLCTTQDSTKKDEITKDESWHPFVSREFFSLGVSLNNLPLIWCMILSWQFIILRQ